MFWDNLGGATRFPRLEGAITLEGPSGTRPVRQAQYRLRIIAASSQPVNGKTGDVNSVEKATAELESQGYRMLVKNKKEPWGQTVSRFLVPEGLLVGITLTPLMRQEG